MRTWTAWVLAGTLLVSAAGVRAQQPPPSPQPSPPPPPKAGNPTPGTAQPDPPNLADRVTLTGCVQLAPGAPPAQAAPTDARYVLAHARKETRVPPDTGASASAAAAAAGTYRLEALESQLSPFLGTQAEISGEVRTAPGAPPALLVEFVQKVDAKCP
jgi:hypothetical protein